MNAFAAILARDLRLSWRQGGASLLTVGFFLVTAALFPLGIGPERDVLARIAPGVMWVTALLSALLFLDRMFQADAEDGTLDQLALAPLPLELTVLAKAGAHWLSAALPLVIASPAIALLFDLGAAAVPVLALSLAIGTPALSLFGAVGAALTVGVRRGGALVSLLVLPLTVPALIFGAGAVEAASLGLDPQPHLLLQLGVSLFALALAPFAAAAGLRLALD
ncbi:MAG: heme exporter protein CcmB [Alphaproteobacteria bacterium]|nr:heme exporter protein CcmB [Alphaproteobacteria bacterium]